MITRYIKYTITLIKMDNFPFTLPILKSVLVEKNVLINNMLPNLQMHYVMPSPLATGGSKITESNKRLSRKSNIHQVVIDFEVVPLVPQPWCAQNPQFPLVLADHHL